MFTLIEYLVGVAGGFAAGTVLCSLLSSEKGKEFSSALMRRLSRPKKEQPPPAEAPASAEPLPSPPGTVTVVNDGTESVTESAPEQPR